LDDYEEPIDELPPVELISTYKPPSFPFVNNVPPINHRSSYDSNDLTESDSVQSPSKSIAVTELRKTHANIIAPKTTVKNAFRQDSSVIIQWDTLYSNTLGFRVVYRLFGDTNFKQGPPLAASEREFKIKNVPSQV
jgi:hypothetical protein